VKAPVAVTAVILLKDIGHDHAYFRILIVQTFAGFVVKITAAGKLQATGSRGTLRASTIRVFSCFSVSES
jgi:hypothetical protein